MARPHPGMNRARIATWAAICLALGTALNVAVAWSLVWLPPLPMGWMKSWDKVSIAPVDSVSLPPDVPRPRKFYSRKSIGQAQWLMIWSTPGPDGEETPSPSRTVFACLLQSGWPILSLQRQEVIDLRLPSTITTTLPPSNLATWRSGIDIGPKRYPLFPVFPGFLINTLLFAAITGAFLWSITAIRIRARTRAGLCPACAYDRRGLSETTPCPECGTSPQR